MNYVKLIPFYVLGSWGLFAVTAQGKRKRVSGVFDTKKEAEDYIRSLDGQCTDPLAQWKERKFKKELAKLQKRFGAELVWIDKTGEPNLTQAGYVFHN